MASIQIRCASCNGVNRVQAHRVSQARCGRCQTHLTPAHPLEVDDAAFDALIQHADVPVLLDIWSPTCGPCLAVAPDVAQLAQARRGQLIVAKIDVSKHQRVAQRLQVQGVPTFAVFRGGQPARVQAGAMRLQQLDSFVQPYLGSKVA